jgi:MYXO-CTERM domain-containing protein
MEIRSFKRCAAHAFTLAVLSMPLIANANLLSNGDFESQPNWGAGVSGNAGYSALTGSQIPGWTIENNHAATVHNTTSYPFITGSYSLNMDGEGYNGLNADLYQDIVSTTGQAYRLSFDWATWYGDSSPKLDVSVVDLTTNAVLYQTNLAWSSGTHTESGSFVGTGNTLRLRVKEAPASGYNDNSYIVDNFAVQAVPEAQTVGLMALGLLVLVGAMRRRRPAK